MRDQDDFLFADKHQDVMLLPVDVITFSWCAHSCPKYPKKEVCNIFVIFQQGGQAEI